MILSILKNAPVLGRTLCNKCYSSTLQEKKWSQKAQTVIYLSGLSLTGYTCFNVGKCFANSNEQLLQEKLLLTQKIKDCLRKKQSDLELDLIKRKSSKP